MEHIRSAMHHIEESQRNLDRTQTLTFEQFLVLLRAKPQTLIRNVHQVFHDMVQASVAPAWTLALPSLQSPAQAAERLIAALEEPVSFDGTLLQVSASVGIASTTPGVARDPAELLHHADLALYASKRAGRGRHRHYETGIDGT